MFLFNSQAAQDIDNLAYHIPSAVPASSLHSAKPVSSLTMQPFQPNFIDYSVSLVMSHLSPNYRCII